ncbi:hypothetical protein [Pantoea sp. AS142]|uniref:hypothetical protein n=1 Tax=Pantoea sp. AS142 TaxID=3081292 RepID=UPI003019E9FD
MGEVHVANLSSHPSVEQVWGANADFARAVVFATRFAVRAASLSEMIHDAKINRVLIASAMPIHADLLEAAARAG